LGIITKLPSRPTLSIVNITTELSWCQYYYSSVPNFRRNAFSLIIIITDRNIHNNKPDKNVIKKEVEKILEYKDLTTEIQRMWNVKTKVLSVITGATVTISKSFRKYVSNIPGKHEVKELQKTAILGTAHKLRKVLM